MIREATQRENWIRSGQSYHVAEVRMEKEPLDGGHRETWWPRQLGHLFATNMQSMVQRRGKGGLQTGGDGFHCDEKDLRLSRNSTVPIFMQRMK